LFKRPPKQEPPSKYSYILIVLFNISKDQAVVDQLSSSKLKKLADSDVLTNEQREAVNKYLERSESSRVGLRKRKYRYSLGRCPRMRLIKS
jgi:hypothetical protein